MLLHGGALSADVLLTPERTGRLVPRSASYLGQKVSAFTIFMVTTKAQRTRRTQRKDYTLRLCAFARKEKMTGFITQRGTVKIQRDAENCSSTQPVVQFVPIRVIRGRITIFKWL